MTNGSIVIMLILAGGGALPLMGLVGCDDSEASRPDAAIVLVAASLNDVVSDLASQFTQETGQSIAMTAGASGALRRQIEWGAPCSLFISADPAHVEALVREGRIQRGSTRAICANHLVVAVRKSEHGDKRSSRKEDVSSGARHLRSVKWMPALSSVLDATTVRRIGIGNPDYAPAGRYAEQALRRAGLWALLRPKLVMLDDVRSAANALSIGAVDAAIVYSSDVVTTSSLVVAYRISDDQHDPIVYVAGVVEPSDVAQSFLQYMASSDRRSVWRRYGFDGVDSRKGAP